MRRTKAESEETRQRILDAAEEVFMDTGVSSATFDRIAQVAEVSRGAIYWHFANKHDLLKAMIERVRSLHGCMIEREFSDDDDPLAFVAERALQIIDLVENSERTRRVYQIVVTRCEYVSEMQEVLVWKRALHETMIAVFRSAFRASEKRGQLGACWTAETATEVMTCFLTGMLNHWLRYDLGSDFAEVARRSLKSLVESFRAAGPRHASKADRAAPARAEPARSLMDS